MALTQSNISDLAQYQVLLNNISTTLIAEAAINTGLQLITPANVTELNNTYNQTLQNIQAILTEAAEIPV